MWASAAPGGRYYILDSCAGVASVAPGVLPPAQCACSTRAPRSGRCTPVWAVRIAPGCVRWAKHPSARAVRMAPEADPCAGGTHGPGDTCVVCCDMNVGLAQECSHPHDTPARAPQRPQPDRRETPLRAAGGVYHAASPTRSGELARTIPQPRIQLPHTESKNPCTHCQPASPDSARVPNRLPERMGRVTQDQGSLDRDWETSPYGCDVPL